MFGCKGLAFKTRRDLDRHHNTNQHEEHRAKKKRGLDAVDSSHNDCHRCGCGYETNRPDNYRRHIKNPCKKLVIHKFICGYCGGTQDSLEDQILHVDYGCPEKRKRTKKS